jgi:hypothetical protein
MKLYKIFLRKAIPRSRIYSEISEQMEKQMLLKKVMEYWKDVADFRLGRWRGIMEGWKNVPLRQS